MINYANVMYSLLGSLSVVALVQIPTIAQLCPLQPPKSSQLNLAVTNNSPQFSTVNVLAGKPGLPRRRVGGGSRLY